MVELLTWAIKKPIENSELVSVAILKGWLRLLRQGCVMIEILVHCYELINVLDQAGILNVPFRPENLHQHIFS